MPGDDQRGREYAGDQFRVVFDAMQDGLLVADLGTGMFVLGNPAICRMLGCGADEITELGHADIHPAECLPMVRTAIERQLSGAEPVACDIPMLRRDGSTFYADINAVSLEFNGRPCILGIFRDATARRAVEQKLQEKEERYRLLFSELDLAVVIMRGMACIDCNEAALRMYGVGSRDEILSRTPLDFSPVCQPGGEPSAEAAPRHIRRVLEDGHHVFEWMNRRPNGEEFLCEIRLTLLSDGAEPLVQCLVTDVTDFRRAERALRESEAFLRQSQKVSGVGSYMLDVASGTWTGSETMLAIFGLAPEDPRTVASWVERLHPDDRDAVSAYLAEEVLERRQPFDREYRIIRANDNAERWVHGLGVLSFDAEGRPVSMMGTIQDVTTRHLATLEREHLLAAEQAARIEAEMAVKARDEFLSVAAHELKTPLAALRIVAEALAKRRAEAGEIPEFIQKSMETVDRQSQRMVRLVNALLDITRIQTGRFDLNIRTVDLAASVQNVVRRLEPSLEQAGCPVVVDVPGDLVADCDRDRMEQVFENLLSNAMKFAPRGSVEIRGRMEGGVVRFEFRDHGKGIVTGDEDRIFELYDRGDAGLHAGGLGIGLFVCRRILAAHRGFVRAHNAPGGGAVFALEFPVR